MYVCKPRFCYIRILFDGSTYDPYLFVINPLLPTSYCHVNVCLNLDLRGLMCVSVTVLAIGSNYYGILVIYKPSFSVSLFKVFLHKCSLSVVLAH